MIKVSVVNIGEVIPVSISNRETVNVDILTAIVSGGGITDFYDGDYVISPTFEETRLTTKGLAMRDDVIVESIAISTVANESGGRTVIIGG